MKRRTIDLLLALLVLSTSAFSAEPPPKIDPKRIINESNAFLREREPEMTAEEYALYEKVSTMLASQPEFALKLLEAMMNDKEPPSPAFEFILGNAYYAAGQTGKAEASYRRAVKRYPSFLRGWSNLGVLYYSADKFAEAIPCFSTAVTLGDRDPATFGLLAYCLERQGNVVPAEMAYMQALSGEPANTNWMEGLLRIYVQGKQYGRAESLVKNLIKERPRETRYWLAYANILLEENRPLEAIAVLEAASGTGAAGPDELTMLADLYAGQRLVPEAVAAYRQAMVAMPALGEQKLIRFAEALIAGGLLPQAQEVLGSMKPEQLTPAGRIHYLQARSELFLAKKQWPEARQELQELLQQEPLNGKALLNLGLAYAGADDLPHATFAFEAACRIPESAYRANLELANLELRNRHYDRSVAHLEAALKIEHTDAVQNYLIRIKTLVVKTTD
ncbi:MAG: tetratricopeptide repeat protein [Opitutaceae bacterium]|nr:tetratricopeptide repeat protein [Opitutaceae bacterium]